MPGKDCGLCQQAVEAQDTTRCFLTTFFFSNVNQSAFVATCGAQNANPGLWCQSSALCMPNIHHLPMTSVQEPSLFTGKKTSQLNTILVAIMYPSKHYWEQI